MAVPLRPNRISLFGFTFQSLRFTFQPPRFAFQLLFYLQIHFQLLRFTFQLLRFTFQLLRFTFQLLRFTFQLLRFTSHLNKSNALQSMSRGGGGSQLNFGYGCAARSFKMEPFARPIFVKITPSPRLISLLKVP